MTINSFNLVRLDGSQYDEDHPENSYPLFVNDSETCECYEPKKPGKAPQRWHFSETKQIRLSLHPNYHSGAWLM